MKAFGDPPPGYMKIQIYSGSMPADPNEEIPESRLLMEGLIKQEYVSKPMPEATIPESAEIN